MDKEYQAEELQAGAGRNRSKDSTEGAGHALKDLPTGSWAG